jgi:hypothetical protein
MRSPLLVWKSLETQLPGLAAMARDLLCIPLAGVGVERIFNLARDICGYRRGHLLPATIREIILVFHAQRRYNSSSRLQQELSLTIDISDMSAEAMENELHAREEEINLRSEKANSWDKDQYISDEEDAPGAVFPGARSRRAELRKDHRQAVHRPQAPSPIVNHSLSIGQRAARDRQLQQNIERDANVDMRIYDIEEEATVLIAPRPGVGTRSMAVPVARRSVNRAPDNEELFLPPMPSESAKRRALDIIDSYLTKRR